MNRMQTAFTVLNYLITRATIDGTNESGVIRIPYADLLESVGRKIETAEDKQNAELDLIIRIDMQWDEHSDNDDKSVEIDVEFTPDEDNQ